MNYTDDCKKFIGDELQKKGGNSETIINKVARNFGRAASATALRNFKQTGVFSILWEIDNG